MKSYISNAIRISLILYVIVVLMSTATKADEADEKTLSSLPVSFCVSLHELKHPDKGMIGYYNSIAQEGDTIVFLTASFNPPGQPQPIFEKALSVLKPGSCVAFNVPSWQTAKEYAPYLKGKVTELSYDLELWPQSQDESKNIGEASRQMQRVCQKFGFRYSGHLGGRIAEDPKHPNNIQDMARYIDIYLAAWWGYLRKRPHEYVKLLRDQAERVREGNHRAKIKIGVSVADDTFENSVDFQLNIIKSSLDFADGVGIWYDFRSSASRDRLKQLIEQMREK